MIAILEINSNVEKKVGADPPVLDVLKCDI